MGLARNLVRSTVKQLTTRLMDRVGSKVVAGMADTSSDAPNAYYTPKRQLYEEMVESGEAKWQPSDR